MSQVTPYMWTGIVEGRRVGISTSTAGDALQKKKAQFHSVHRTALLYTCRMGSWM